MSRGRALVAAAAAAAAAAQQAGCSFDSGVGVSFDLSPLRSDTGYTMVDVNNKSDPSGDPTITAQWEFRFSICQDMDGKAGFPGGPGASVCATTQSDAVPGGPPPVSNSNPAPAFRYCTGNCGTLPASMRPCQRLGDTAANAQLLTHPWNLASGVTVQYTGGDNCTSKCVKARVVGAQRRAEARGYGRYAADTCVLSSHVSSQAGRLHDPALAAHHHAVCGRGARRVEDAQPQAAREYASSRRPPTTRACPSAAASPITDA